MSFVLTPKLKTFLKSKGFMVENVEEDDAEWLHEAKSYKITEDTRTGWWDTRIQDKDLMRIADIIKKSNGDETKAQKLAATMCKLITTTDKAIRRGKAALSKGMTTLAGMFFERAIELDPATEKQLTPEELEATKTKKGVGMGRKLGILDF